MNLRRSALVLLLTLAAPSAFADPTPKPSPKPSATHAPTWIGEDGQSNFDGQTRNSVTSGVGTHGPTTASNHLGDRGIPAVKHERPPRAVGGSVVKNSSGTSWKGPTATTAIKGTEARFGHGKMPGVTMGGDSGKTAFAVGGVSPCGETGRCEETIIEGDHGKVIGFLDMNRMALEGGWGYGYQNGGFQIEAGGRAQYTLVGVGMMAEGGLGDPNGMTKAYGQVTVQATVGADASGSVAARVDSKGVAVDAQAELFAGAKIGATGFATAEICGVSVNLTGVVEAYAGAGVKASGTFSIDWSTATVRVGVMGGAAVGLGAGAGATIEVSLADVLKDPGAALECVADGLDSVSKYLNVGPGGLLAAADYLMGSIKEEQEDRRKYQAALALAMSRVNAITAMVQQEKLKAMAQAAINNPSSPFYIGTTSEPANCSMNGYDGAGFNGMRPDATMTGIPGMSMQGGGSHDGAGVQH